MDPSTAISALLLFSLLCRGGGEISVETSVHQTPLIQVALAEESVLINCTVTFHKDISSLTMDIYSIDSPGQETLVPYKTSTVKRKQYKGNITETQYEFSFQPIRGPRLTGNTYYCIAKTTLSLTKLQGIGTFTHIRDTGYINKTVGRHRALRICLITACCFLGALSLTGTGLLLLWRKKGYPALSCLKAHRANGDWKEAVTGSSSRPEASTSGSIYSTLQPHAADLYDSLEQDSTIQSQDSTQSDPPSQSTTQNIRKKSPDAQVIEKKAPANEIPSTPKHKEPRKKSREGQAGGKNKVTDLKPKQAAAQEEIFDTVYENL